MAIKSFKASIGLQRINKGTRVSQARATRNTRTQFKDIEKNISKFLNTIEVQLPEALREALTPTFEKALTYVPVDTGKLKDSGFLDVEREDKRVKASIGFGKGGDPFYAIFVHERTDLRHKAPTRAKFLQAALEEDADLIVPRLQEAYKKRKGN